MMWHSCSCYLNPQNFILILQVRRQLGYARSLGGRMEHAIVHAEHRIFLIAPLEFLQSVVDMATFVPFLGFAHLQLLVSLLPPFVLCQSFFEDHLFYPVSQAVQNTSSSAAKVVVASVQEMSNGVACLCPTGPSGNVDLFVHLVSHLLSRQVAIKSVGSSKLLRLQIWIETHLFYKVISFHLTAILQFHWPDQSKF
jgi:hypothetical protein